ncbi:MAG: MoaD/ThiS family protein [Candidatus Bipolaricaulota bacterium]
MIEVTITIYFTFRGKLEGSEPGIEVELPDNSTVYDAIQTITELHPDLDGKILANSNRPRRFIQIRINKQGIEHLSGLKTKLDDGDDLIILPKLGGG